MIWWISRLVERVVPRGGAGLSADPSMSGGASLRQPSLAPAAGSAACPCPPHTELLPGRYAGWAERRCRPATRMWTPPRPPAGRTWLLHGASGRRRCDLEESGYRWLYATATGCPSGCVDWRRWICHTLQRSESRTGEKWTIINHKAVFFKKCLRKFKVGHIIATKNMMTWFEESLLKR